jgi:hypothetical protein
MNTAQNKDMGKEYMAVRRMTGKKAECGGESIVY